jgi:mRNA-degrading endonuclease RelE of RelBE toxin-antitoxin system
MSVSIITTDNFRREAKKLIKKYRSLRDELQQLSEELEENPKLGTLITENVYKIRLAVKSKGKGKSGGLRIITYVDVEIQEIDEDNTNVYLLSIYDKSDYENISDKQLKSLIDDVQTEIEQSEENDESPEENDIDQEDVEEDSDKK